MTHDQRTVSRRRFVQATAASSLALAGISFGRNGFAQAFVSQWVQGCFYQGNQATLSCNPGNTYQFCPLHSLGIGNRCILLITFSNAVTVSTISDTINGSWSTTADVSAAGSSFNTNVYQFLNCSAGLPVITVVFSADVQGPIFTFIELSGTSTSIRSGGTANAGNQTGPTVNTGSFTPTNNDAYGGNYILFAAHQDYGGGTNPTAISASSGFTLLHSDIGGCNNAGLPKAHSFEVQTAAASVNPGCTMTEDTADTYNCVAIAIPLSPGAGSPLHGGIRLLMQSAHCTSSPGTTWKNQVAFQGSTRIMLASGPQFTAVSDSDGNTWNFVPNDDSPGCDLAGQIWYFTGASPNSACTVTQDVSSSHQAAIIFCRFYDAVGMVQDNNSIIGANAFETIGGVTNENSITPTMANSLVMIKGPDGNGPVTSITSPTNAVDHMVHFTTSFDSDTYDSGDGDAHFPVTAGMVGVSQSISWTVASGSVTSHAAEFLPAVAATEGTLPLMGVKSRRRRWP